MSSDKKRLRVAIAWDELAREPAQVERIRAASGSEPVAWDGNPPAPDVEVLVAEDLPEAIPEAMPHLRMVQVPSAGVDWMRTHPIWQSDVAICSASGVHGVQIAEHVMMLALALRRHLPQFVEAQRAHQWRHDTPTPPELYGATLGLVGYGHIGRGVAHLARAFGMRVLATSASARERRPLAIPGVAPFADPPAIPAESEKRDEMLPHAELPQLLGAADVVVICAALTPQTEGLIDAAALRQLKPGALLINIARGKIVVEAALIEALREGRLAGAGLDVTAEEPLPPQSPLWDLPNVIVTPHVSGKSLHYVERTVNILCANIAALQRGEPLPTAVDRGRGY